MFQMTVEDALRVHDNLITVAGPCVNKYKFRAGMLRDDQGVEYDAHVPFSKTLVFDDTSVILGIYGKMDAKSMIRKTLYPA